MHIKIRNIIHDYINFEVYDYTYGILSNLKSKKRGLNLDEIDDYEIWKNNLQLKVKILLKIIHKIRFILNF